MIKPLYVSNIIATDLTGQRRVRARAPKAASMGDFVGSLLPRLNLPPQDSAGRALTYHARVDRLGRHAHASETVGEVLEPNDQISLHPNVDAGGAR
ncbi:MAG TPA: hypothetical protein P5205_03085 [Candidatus Paceibacterota bacterium]|nr:hypothetical protein [Verrucomicrobiota bacterium]HSA09333.1 hypothetical protein [Candidatus Paceibacterota bacterium]